MVITITLNTALDRTLHIANPLTTGKLNRALSSHLEPGGKGINVSRAVKALGGDTVALGFCGGTNGRIIKDMLTSESIHHDFIDVASQTRVNTQIIDANGGHTEINEPGSKIDDADFLRLVDRMDSYLTKENIFVISGSCPPEFPVKNYKKLCKTIKKAGCKLIVDAQGEMLSEALSCNPDFIKPNIFELAEAVGAEPTSDPERVVVSARKMLEMGANAVCVSMSQDGAVFVSKDESEELFVNCNPKIHDIGAVGTGDAMVGAIANSVNRGLSFAEMARYAVSMGRACALIDGTEMASLKKVYSVYETTEVYTI